MLHDSTPKRQDFTRILGGQYARKGCKERTHVSGLTMGGHKPSIAGEQATSSYSFRFPELSQPI
jgi:hypothetical protein